MHDLPSSTVEGSPTDPTDMDLTGQARAATIITNSDTAKGVRLSTLETLTSKLKRERRTEFYRRPPHTPPTNPPLKQPTSNTNDSEESDEYEIPPESQDELKELMLKTENLRLHEEIKDMKRLMLQPSKALTEREEINKVQDTLNVITKTIETALNNSSLNGSAAARALAQVSENHTQQSTISLIYSLERPKNIVPSGTKLANENKSQLKPTIVQATIGIFDPDKDPKANFRDVWSRIIEYTRPHKVYEYEYIQILMAVMKGSAATLLDNMIKEFEGNLMKIIEALQDVFVPHHTVYDDYDEIGKFTRNAKEGIRPTIVRAGLLVYKLKNTVSPAAWPEKRHSLIMSMVKQVIDRKTFKHLRAKELECAQAGRQLSLEAATDIIHLYEMTHELVPTRDIPLKFNVNSMSLIDQPDVMQSQIEELRQEFNSKLTQINMLRPNKNNNGHKEKAQRKINMNKGQPNGHRTQAASTIYGQQKGIRPRLIATYNRPPPSRPQPSQQQPRWRAIEGPSQIKPRLEQYKDTTMRQRRMAQYPGMRQTNFIRPGEQKRISYSANGANGRNGANGVKMRQNNKNLQEGRVQNRNNKKGKHNMMRRNYNFYKCSICPDIHPQGTVCAPTAIFPQITHLN